MSKIDRSDRHHKSDYICDDRVNYLELGERINSMTDEEFEAYCAELKRLTIKCPIIEKEIEEDVCFEDCMISEGMCPERFAPEEMFEIEDFKQICFQCKNHRE